LPQAAPRLRRKRNVCLSLGPQHEIVFRSYRIFYDVSEESHSVEILHVWHGKRDEPTFERS
jgi:plasmid stabilization system protein ParE